MLFDLLVSTKWSSIVTQNFDLLPHFSLGCYDTKLQSSTSFLCVGKAFNV